MRVDAGNVDVDAGKAECDIDGSAWCSVGGKAEVSAADRRRSSVRGVWCGSSAGSKVSKVDGEGFSGVGGSSAGMGKVDSKDDGLDRFGATRCEMVSVVSKRRTKVLQTLSTASMKSSVLSRAIRMSRYRWADFLWPVSHQVPMDDGDAYGEEGSGSSASTFLSSCLACLILYAVY